MEEWSPSLQLQMIPEISTPKRGAINTEAMALGGPSPGAVEWLNHAASFKYTAPATVETFVEAVFRQCRYNARCADENFREKARTMKSPVEAYEEHFSWWCRRCWEDRRTKEAAEAVKRQKTQLQLVPLLELTNFWVVKVGLLHFTTDFCQLLSPSSTDFLYSFVIFYPYESQVPLFLQLRHRAFVLASFCRFSTTARKAASAACAAGSGGPGGSAELLRDWQRCRQARAWPRHTAESAESFDDVAEATEWCCGDLRCMNRLMELQPALKERKQQPNVQ
eukprot:Skav204872  [mRNA]  locus=scaffold1679:102940:103776:- [translate_table: standard]